MSSVLLDLAPGDVHQPSASAARSPMASKKTKGKKVVPTLSPKVSKGRIRVRADLGKGGHISVRSMADAINGAVVLLPPVDLTNLLDQLEKE